MRFLDSSDRVRSPYLRPAVILALNTGMPRGELLSLQWEQIDFIHSRIRILDAKTNSGERPILMNSVVSALLNDLAKKKSSNLVFPSNRKVPERFLDLKKGIKKAVQLASIAPIRFHDLRQHAESRIMPNLFQIHRLEGL